MTARNIDAALRPWAVAESEYPDGSSAEVRFLLRYAILASSGRNRWEQHDASEEAVDYNLAPGRTWRLVLAWIAVGPAVMRGRG